MSVEPLKWMALRRSGEAFLEVVVPLTLATLALGYARAILGAPTASRAFSAIEVASLVGACVALVAWTAGRQTWLAGYRSPARVGVVAVVVCVLLAAALPPLVAGRFESGCEALAGTLVAREGDARLCQVGAVPGNPYLPGTLLREPWGGTYGPLGWAGVVFVALVASLGLRDQNLRPTRIAAGIFRSLRLAPSSGACLGGAPKDGRVQACANATFWGEVCGQLYAGQKEFAPGEWCVRCHQVYRRADRELTFKVVTLFTADVDVLNGLERLDTVSRSPGEPMPADARISGQERWVDIGRLTVPDVLSVAQVLALAHDQLKVWGQASNPAVAEAARLASERASRIAAWIWTGNVSHLLTHARPTSDPILAVGPVRLRDLLGGGADELTLQLDVGLLPLELRVGFRTRFLAEDRPPLTQYSRTHMWIPTAPPPAKEGAGLWVPRIEGDALRAWIASDRLRAGDVRGATIPLPYRPWGADEADVRLPNAGSLDYIRAPLDPTTGEPVAGRRLADSVAEWEWLDFPQLELLRREALVLVEGRA